MNERSFEERMRAVRHGNSYGITTAGFVDFEDAIKLAREADAEIARLTALSKAKDKLIEFYETYLARMSGYMLVHHIGATPDERSEGERLRVAIKELEK